MKTRDEHLKQARDNETFAERLLLSGDTVAINWAATAIFYSAVHYGRAFLAAKSTRTITTHVGFETLFRRAWTQPPDLFSEYRKLKIHSERARYDSVEYPIAEILDLRDQQLRPFREAIMAALGLP